MTDSLYTLQARRSWVQLYLELGHAGRVCLRCGISRPTLRKWVRRYRAHGEQGLHSRSRVRKQLPPRQVTPAEEQHILHLRNQRNLGPKRIQAELMRAGLPKRSTSTIWKVLQRHHCGPLRRPKRPRKPKRYQRPVPGERVQLDSCKIAPGLYQFTAIDDCTRLRVLGLYPDRSADSAVAFLQERVVPELPFPIQRVQTDRGREFHSRAFTEALQGQRIKYRPNRPAAPHLNGKVERSQQTDLMEFWATVSVHDADVPLQLRAWQRFYNRVRPHSALGGRTPYGRLLERAAVIPTPAEVAQAYDPAREQYDLGPYRRKKILRIWN